MLHIYNCEQLNQESEHQLEYENIFSGNSWDPITFSKLFILLLI